MQMKGENGKNYLCHWFTIVGIMILKSLTVKLYLLVWFFSLGISPVVIRSLGHMVALFLLKDKIGSSARDVDGPRVSHSKSDREKIAF